MINDEFMERVADFYNQRTTKFLKDYIYGNPRTISAIQFAVSEVPKGSARILDIGCGIGWSTWELHQSNPSAMVYGVDLSGELIRVANQLFNESGIKFSNHNILNWGVGADEPFDVVVGLDVYEHIALDQRRAFHDVLNRLLKPDGVVILSCPTVSQQNFLKINKPEGLQPINEDVSLEILETLAIEISGTVVSYEEVSIWSDGDYLHSVITRGGHTKTRRISAKRPLSENQPARQVRVKRALQVRVSSTGLLLRDHGDTAVAVVTPSVDAASETFIRAHIERLPGKVHVAYGGHFPTYREDGMPFEPHLTLWRHIRQNVKMRLRGKSWEQLRKEPFVEWLRKIDAKAVLAEYGQTGAALMDVCAEEKLPLIVHFHGYDAYRNDVLNEYREQYKRLFDIASAFVVLSEAMKGQLVSLGAPINKIFVNACGIDTDLFYGASPIDAPPLFVTTGRFVDKKGPIQTLFAFRKTLDVTSDAKLIMVGKGPLWEASVRLCNALGIADSVEFRGSQTPQEVAGLMRSGRAFVQHSVVSLENDSEGMPSSILEAASTGLPIISTNHAGIPEAVIHGETGYIVEENDIDGMAGYMISLARDAELADGLGRAGRARVEDYYSSSVSINRLMSIIKTAISS